MIYLNDLVQDLVRSRLVFPLAILMLYVLIVVNLQQLVSTSKKPPSEVKQSLPLQLNYTIGALFSSSFPAPRVQVTNSDGPIVQAQVQVQISQVIQSISTSLINCDSEFRYSFVNTIEFLRLQKVCQVKLNQNSNYTDENGIAVFYNYGVKYGPQATYYQTFVSYSASAVTYSTPASFYMQSEAATIIVDQTILPPVYSNIGEAFIPAPKVSVLDINGKPIVGARVVAFSWPEPKFSGVQQPLLNDPHRFSYLINDEAFTNSEGVAVFTGLTIIGSNSPYCYIYFAVDGFLQANWGVKEDYYAQLLDIKVHYQSPIRLQTNVNTIKIVAMDSEVVEEKVFNLQVQILDSTGKPIQNKMVFASIYHYDGEVYPGGYQPNYNGMENKELYYPIPGVYQAETNSLGKYQIMYPILTDVNGNVKFNRIMFSQHGNSGVYNLKIQCDGVYITSPNIKVSTSVKSLIFAAQPITQINTQTQSVEDVLKPIIRVLDGQSEGVIGKTPQVQIMSPDKTKVYDASIIDLRLNLDNPYFSPSDAYGYCVLYFSLNLINTQVVSSFILAISVDSITIYSQPITIQQNNQLIPQQCGTVTLSSQLSKNSKGNPYLNVATDQQFSLNFNVLKIDGTSIGAGSKVYLYGQYSSTSPTQFPTSVLPNIMTLPTAAAAANVITDNTGAAQIKMTLGQGTTGEFKVRGLSYTILNSQALTDAEVESMIQNTSYDPTTLELININLAAQVSNQNLKICTSSYISLYIKSVVQDFELQGFYTSTGIKISLQYTQFQPILTVQTYTAKYVILDENNKPIPNRQVNVGPQLYIYPRYLLTQQPQALSITNQLLTSDANGIITINFSFNDGYVGDYALQFFGDGSYSDVMLLRVLSSTVSSLPSTTISINSEFTNATPVEAGIYMPQAQSTLTYTNSLNQQVPAVGFTQLVYQQSVNSVDKVTLLTSPTSLLDINQIVLPNQNVDNLAVIANNIRSAISNSNGQSIFNRVTVFSMSAENENSQACATYSVGVGWIFNAQQSLTEGNFQTKPLFITQGNKVKCFTYSQSVRFSSTSYSRITTSGSPFTSSFQLTVQKQQALKNADGSYYELNGIIMFIAYPIQIQSNYIQPNQMSLYSSLYLANNVCLYKAGVLIGKSINQCSSLPTSTDFSLYTVSMNTLQWTQTKETTFRLGFSDPLNFPTWESQNVEAEGENIKVENVVASNYNTVSEIITVTNKPALVEFITQPSSQVVIGESFLVQVSVSISTGQKVAYMDCSAYLMYDPSEVSSLPSSQISNLLSLLSNPFVSPNKISAQATMNKNVLLDQTTVKTKTNAKGIASFNLKLLSGIPGTYTLLFQSQTAKSNPSNAFQLVNYISSISFVVQPDSVITANLDSSPQLINFKRQPVVKISYQNGMAFIGNKLIELMIYQYVDPNQIAAQQKQASESLQGLLTQLDSEPAALQNDPTSLIQNAFNAIINGGQLVASTQLKNISLYYQFSYPLESFDGTLNFTNIAFNWVGYGDFMLVVKINGIESVASTKITVQKGGTSILDQILAILVKILVISLVLAALIGVTKHNNIYFAIISVCIIIVCMILLFNQQSFNSALFFNSFVAVDTGLILIILIFAIVMHFKKNTKHETAQIITNLQIECAHQQIFNSLSKSWADAKNDPNVDYIFPFESREESLEFLPELTKEEPLKEQLAGMFMPLDKLYQERDVRKSFHYPQRLLGATLLSLASVVYVAYNLFNLSGNIQSMILKLAQNFQNASNTFMFTAMSNIQQQIPNFQLPESQFGSATSALAFLVNQLRILAQNIQISFYIGSSLACVFYLIGLFLLFRDFRRRVLLMRRGKHEFDYQKIQILPIVMYCGIQVANSLISFVIVFAVFCLIFTIILHPLFWQFLYSYLPVILGLFASSTMIVKIIVTLAQKILIDPSQVIKYRGPWSVLEILMIYLAIVGGLLSALGRLIMLIVFSILGLVRLDQSLFPKFINDVVQLDGPFKTYLSVVTTYHLYCNPIGNTFVKSVMLFIENSEQKEQHKEIEEIHAQEVELVEAQNNQNNQEQEGQQQYEEPPVQQQQENQPQQQQYQQEYQYQNEQNYEEPQRIKMTRQQAQKIIKRLIFCTQNEKIKEISQSIIVLSDDAKKRIEQKEQEENLKKQEEEQAQQNQENQYQEEQNYQEQDANYQGQNYQNQQQQ